MEMCVCLVCVCFLDMLVENRKCGKTWLWLTETLLNVVTAKAKLWQGKKQYRQVTKLGHSSDNTCDFSKKKYLLDFELALP